MSRGSIKFSDEELHWIELLKHIYEFESIRVAGPGSNHRDINDALWTIDELLEADTAIQNRIKELNELIGWLEERKQILVIRSKDGPTKYLTRVAEIVRLLGHTYEYWHKGRAGIEATRWLIETKKVPLRNVDAEKAQKRLRNMVEREIGTGISIQNLLKAIDYVVEGTAKYLKGKDWKRAKFSEFQIEATEEMIKSQFKKNHDRRTQILTAGVGTGKTIGFTMGMMISAVEGLLGGHDSGRCHLFLYPRTALARDQYQKLRSIAKNIPFENLTVHFEHMEHYKKMGWTVRKGIEEMYSGTYPFLIVTTLETLKRRLQQPVFVRTMCRRLARVVLDEIHLVRDLTGTQIAHLMERLKAVAPRGGLLWTGSSATVACPERHAATVFGVQEKDVRAIEPHEEDKDVIGLVHHVFLRPGNRISTLGCLVNSTSILIHNRRNNIGNRQQDVSEMCKTIGFADNLDIIGRWNEDLRENERTENDLSTTWGRRHPIVDDRSRWKSREREVPYALRFQNPFTRRLNVPPGKGKNPYESITLDVDINPCEKCKLGKSLSLGVANDGEMRSLGRFVYREPSKDKDDVEEFIINNPRIFERGAKIGTLNLCPYLRAGACFWFSEDDFRIETIPTLKRIYEFRSIARSRIYSSKVGSIAVDDDDLSSLAFQSCVSDVYGPFYGREMDYSSPVPVDMVISSPSLEVGIDLPNVTESFMFKAIRNVSSYRQKVGRAGREKGTDTMNVTLLSSRATDFHYYRQPRKLVSTRTLDPIPLKRENPLIMRSSVYMAIWDLLALQANLPESIPLRSRPNGRSELADRIERCLRYIDENREQMLSHLSTIAGHQLDMVELKAALTRVELDLQVFLIPTSGIIQGNELTCIADMIVNGLKRYGGVKERLNLEIRTSFDDLNRSNERYDSERPNLDPISLNLSDLFDSLDRMRRCGWDRKRLDDAIISLKKAQNEDLDAILVDLRRISKALKIIEAHGNPIVLFFREQFNKCFEGDNKRKAFYLSYIIEDIPFFDGKVGDLRFPRPKNLFTNPYEEEVILMEAQRTGTRKEINRHDIGTALISEVLYSYIPGTWTYRSGHPMKVNVGPLDGEGRNLVARYQNIVQSGAAFSKLKRNVDGPPFLGPETIDLYQPRVLTVERSRKYVLANKERGTINDQDEEEKDSREEKEKYVSVKVPKCYFEGWTHISFEKGNRVLVNDLGIDRMRFIPGEKGSSDSLHCDIIHPLQSHLISNATWIPKMEVIEYVFSISRSYTSRDVVGATLTFHDFDKMSDIGFGRLMQTEGVHLELDPDIVGRTISLLMDAMKTNPLWSPTSLQAFRAMLNEVTLEDGVHVSPFISRDLVSLVLYDMIDNLEDVTFPRFIEQFQKLVTDTGHLKELAREHIVTRYHEIIDDAKNDGIVFPSETEDEIQSEVSRICNIAIDINERLLNMEIDTDKFLEKWISTTLLNTFGIAAYHALQRLCGTEDKVGYLPNLKNIQQGRYGIFLYDKDENGNGSCELLRSYFHILYLQRVAGEEERSKLPTEDFLTILEQELLQCPQFHTDIGALELHRQYTNGTSSGIPELGYVYDHSIEVEDISRKVWNTLGIRGMEDAWKLPLFAAIPHLAAKYYGLEMDDISRATNICWNGCPECVATDQMLMGPMRGRDYVDKAILDLWFRIGRLQTREYKSASPVEMMKGQASIDIGTNSRLCLLGEQRLWRSVSLPFMIGVELDRDALTERPRFVIRDNDIVGMVLTDRFSEGTARAISIGFGRLVWYNLLMTAYLDSIGCIDANDKKVLMVFYDISDIPLDEIGMSERMLEALEYHRRHSGQPGRLEKLSDFLCWLSSRDFKITICIDTERARDNRVIGLFRCLREVDPSSERINILTKKIPKGAMHIKGIVTPIGAIDGSANLTLGGIRKNDESVNHANVGTADYRNIVRRLQDALHGSVEWKGG